MTSTTTIFIPKGQAGAQDREGATGPVASGHRSDSDGQTHAGYDSEGHRNSKKARHYERGGSLLHRRWAVWKADQRVGDIEKVKRLELACR